VKEWHQTLLLQGVVFGLLSPILYGWNHERGLAFALGSGLMFFSVAISAMIHFRGSAAPAGHTVFKQAMKAIVIILGIMLVLRYTGKIDWLFFFVGLLSVQQLNWVVPIFWREGKGKDR
jgi:F0F1-type ATP synthase assembly protein I